jgi:hypothetical protein
MLCKVAQLLRGIACECTGDLPRGEHLHLGAEWMLNGTSSTAMLVCGFTVLSGSLSATLVLTAQTTLEQICCLYSQIKLSRGDVVPHLCFGASLSSGQDNGS